MPTSIWISTHAPRTGSDRRQSPCRRIGLYFNPRSPHGERQSRRARSTSPRLFQPTLPARGATRRRCTSHDVNRRFQPTLPARGATNNPRWDHPKTSISTHAPRTGSDVDFPALGVSQQIFQPTLPARGATPFAVTTPASVHNFNPRSPHGERPHHFQFVNRHKINFNPRSPHGERRIVMPQGRTRGDFNPRSPHGERLLPGGGRCTPSKFQPTLPARGATSAWRRALYTVKISTHAPRTGSDSSVVRWGIYYRTISTHAPRTGSDHKKSQKKLRKMYFNPRSPHGERRDSLSG